MTEFGGASGG